MTHPFKDYRYWRYITQDDFTTAPNKQEALEVFKRFYGKIESSEVKEVILKDYVKENKKTI